MLKRRSRRSAVLTGVLPLAAASLILFVAPGWAAGATYTYVVDGSTNLGAWSHFYEAGVDICHVYTVLSSSYGRNIQNALKKGNQEAGFRMFRGHGVLDTDVGIYKETNGTPVYDWSKFDQIYDYATSIGMHPVLELSFMVSAIASGSYNVCWYNNNSGNGTPPSDYNKWRSIVTQIVQHCETRYGVDEVRNNWYFEVWNEPNLTSSFFSGTQADYFKMYDYASDGVALADSNCKVGGPSVTGKGIQWIDDFLNHAINGTNAASGKKGCKVDFISFHRYCNDDPSNAISNPALTVNYHKDVMNVIKKYAFKGKVLCDEWAPTWASDSTHSELESAGTFVAKTIHMLNVNDSFPAPDFYSWFCLSDIFEEWDTGTPTAFQYIFGLMLKGSASIADSWDVAKPVFNVFKMLHMMGTRRLSCTGGSFTTSANAAATLAQDGGSIQILLYDHVNGGLASPATANTVNLTVNNIPFAPCSLKVERYAVDVSHSNSYRAWIAAGRPAQPSAQQWATINQQSALAYGTPVSSTRLTAKTYSTTFTMNTYGTSLLVLTNMSGSPVMQLSRKSAVSGRPVVRIGGGMLSITPNGAGRHTVRVYSAGGRLAASFAGNGPRDYEIPTRSLPRGLCVIQADTGGRIFVAQAVICR